MRKQWLMSSKVVAMGTKFDKNVEQSSLILIPNFNNYRSLSH